MSGDPKRGARPGLLQSVTSRLLVDARSSIKLEAEYGGGEWPTSVRWSAVALALLLGASVTLSWTMDLVRAR